MDIVCGALNAKLQTKNLSSGSSRCISSSGKIFTPCEFERMLVNHLRETGNLRFVTVENRYQRLLKFVRPLVVRNVVLRIVTTTSTSTQPLDPCGVVPSES